MTGLDRLRGYARRMDELHVWPSGAKLLDIADQIEREHDADVADSPYDAIRPEDREAAAWVREHGGLDAVRSEWSSRVPYDKHEQRRQRLLDHIAECETALGRRNARIEGLGHHVSDLKRENAELRRRAMPEGIEWLVEAWPRFEDDAPVKFGDEVPTLGIVNKIILFPDWSFSLEDGWACHHYKHGERVKRPAPKALDADGMEIREKRAAWWICEGDERGVHAERLRVEAICPNGLIECSPYNGGTWVYLEPSELYVNKPVPASDGRPLREGETVWLNETGLKSKLVDRGEPLEVVAFDKKGNVGVLDRDGIVLEETSPWWFNPSCLTHERPDSWERLEKDANASVCTYFGAGVKDCESCDHDSWECSYDKARDIVRRAKALAGGV